MNIFVLDPDPEKAASMLCDCHVRKMCLETAQILSACMVIRDIPLEDETILRKDRGENARVII